jgi:hypothetical protein
LVSWWWRWWLQFSAINQSLHNYPELVIHSLVHGSGLAHACNFLPVLSWSDE